MTTTAQSDELLPIVAHRGASHAAPENTLPAFDLAWQEGADWIEGDFRLTADGTIVCIHDGSTKRTSDKNITVASATAEKLNHLDVGQWFRPTFSGTRIPTLTQVLQSIPKEKGIFIEIKSGPEIVPELLRVVDQSGLSPSHFRIICFNTSVISAISKQRPTWPTTLLSGLKGRPGAWSPAPAELVAKAKACGADAVGVDGRRGDATYFTTLQKLIPYHAWTIDDSKRAKLLIEWGVQSITTNRPAAMRNGLTTP